MCKDLARKLSWSDREAMRLATYQIEIKKNRRAIQLYMALYVLLNVS
jgi:hypothetical protein